VSDESARRALFRPEAVEHHARSMRAGSVLPLSPRGLAVPFWTLLALVAVGVAALCTVQADERARGVARVTGESEIAVYFPVAVTPDLHPGMTISLDGPGAGHAAARLVTVGPAVTGSVVRGIVGKGATPPGLDAAVTVTVRLIGAPSARAAATYRADVVLRRQPIVKLLVPGLRSLIGRRG
jgi:hypothetical protein